MGDRKNAPTAGIEPVTSRSLGGHHIHYTTATQYSYTAVVADRYDLSVSRLSIEGKDNTLLWVSGADAVGIDIGVITYINTTFSGSLVRKKPV
ncbi:hypothetical protein DPMN_074086 [Dreissena polymorpha]|uniref:Uncharacterized protein n=1 Tax=Dreissena polymorpha TaxID=45954 RepID=A0A9D3YEN6_DREPO|nr:hypothetical protein DPMN_074086 [Dreissena polymorpha]